MQAKTVEADAQIGFVRDDRYGGRTCSGADGGRKGPRPSRKRRCPGLRDEAAKASAALQRLTIARDQLDAEAERLAARKREYEQRLEQIAADMERERRLTEENAELLSRRSMQKGLSYRQPKRGEESRETELAERAEAARRKLEAGETELSERTEARAETAALRVQLERRISEARVRAERLDREQETARAELAALQEKIAGLPDPAEKQQMVEAADAAVSTAEEQVAEAEAAVQTARDAEAELRPDLARRTRRTQRVASRGAHHRQASRCGGRRLVSGRHRTIDRRQGL